MDNNDINLSVTVGDLKLKNPLILSSACYTRVARGIIKYANAGFAAVVTKTITPEPWGGNPTPRNIFINSTSFIGAQGLPNVGFKAMLSEIGIAKRAIKGDVRVIVSITANELSEWAGMAEGFEDAGADAIEIAIFGCPNYIPNTRISNAYWEQTPKRIEAVIKTVKNNIAIPVWVKTLTRSVECIKAMESGGADAILSANLVRCFPIDVDTGKPLLGHPYGIGPLHSTGYVKYINQQIVMDLVRITETPVIGIGGIWEGKDVVEYVKVGATATQVCSSVILKGPKQGKYILNGIKDVMIKNGYSSLIAIKGQTLKHLPANLWLFNNKE